MARGLIVSGLRHALADAGHRASSTVAGATLGAMRPEPVGPSGPSARVYQMDRPSQGAIGASYVAQAPLSVAPGFAEAALPSARIEPTAESQPEPTDRPLGAARAQLHENYIVAQTVDGMVIVDQHAAHERLVYERLKRQMAEAGVAGQALLIPEIVDLSDGDCARLLSVAEDLRQLGLTIEPFGGCAVAVRETPAILGEIDAAALIADILDEIADLGDSTTLGNRIDAVLSRVPATVQSAPGGVCGPRR